MKAIYLTGFMGAGKTTIGEQLAEKLNLPVFDTDKEVVKKIGLTIKEIFETYGEESFRNYETEVLMQLPIVNTIITTGGGIVIKERNREIMNKHGYNIFLYADLDVIYERIHTDINRPIANKKSKPELKELYNNRKEYYENCTFMINTENKQITEIVDEIILRLKELEVGHK